MIISGYARLAVLITAAALGLAACDQTKRPAATAADAATAQSEAKAREVVDIATDAYIYGYSLITTEVTRVQMSNVDKPEGCMRRWASSSTSSAIRRPTSAACRRPTPTRSIRVAWLDLARAEGLQASGHGQALLPVPDDRSLDDRFQFARHPHRRQQGRQLPDHRSGLDGQRPGRA